MAQEDISEFLENQTNAIVNALDQSAITIITRHLNLLTTEGVIVLTQPQELEALLNRDVVSVIFWGMGHDLINYCRGCATQEEQVFHAWRQKDPTAQLIKIDTHMEPLTYLANQYGVYKAPTIMFFRKGKKIYPSDDSTAHHHFKSHQWHIKFRTILGGPEPHTKNL
jgi:hypothetical protein